MLTLQSSTISAGACLVRALFMCFLKHFISVRITLNTGITYLYVICLCEHPVLHLSACASQRQTADVKSVTKMSMCFLVNTVPSCVWWFLCCSGECDQGKRLEIRPAGLHAGRGSSLGEAPPLQAVSLSRAWWHHCMGGASSVHQA